MVNVRHRVHDVGTVLKSEIDLEWMIKDRMLNFI